LIRQILVHLIKSASEPHSRAGGHWRSEAVAFSVDLRDHYFPSMRQNIDMQALWEGALKVDEAKLQENTVPLSGALPHACPYSLKDVVSPDFSFDRSLAQLTKNRSVD
jgi:hypothetical protein